MRSTGSVVGLTTLAAMLTCASAASAATVFLGFTFEDTAFADTVLSDTSAHTVWNAPSAEAALTGADADSTAFNTTVGSFVTMGFTDNSIVNGVGADLIVFELFVSGAEDIVATINGVQSAPEPQTPTGFVNGDGYAVYYSTFDLSNFGIADNEAVDAVTLQGVCNPTVGCSEPTGLASSAFVAFGALNSAPLAPVPLPASALLFSFALMIFGAFSWLRGRKEP